MGFGGALYRRDNVGRPWAPPWWFSFVVLPIMVIASFYISQVTGWRGVASSNAEAVSWSEVSSEGIFLYVLLYLGFYFVLVLPIFLVRRHLWEKKQTQLLNKTFAKTGILSHSFEQRPVLSRIRCRTL